MKLIKTITLFLIFFSASSIFGSALDKGSKTVGGGAAFIHRSGDLYYDYSSLTFSSKYSTAYSYGSFFGWILEIEYVSIDKSSNTDIALGFVFEKYMKSRYSSNNAFPFIRTLATIGSQSKTTTVTMGVDLGLAFMLSDAFTLEIGGAYRYNHFSVSGNSISGNALQAKAGLTTFIF